MTLTSVRGRKGYNAWNTGDECTGMFPGYPHLSKLMQDTNFVSITQTSSMRAWIEMLMITSAVDSEQHSQHRNQQHSGTSSRILRFRACRCPHWRYRTRREVNIFPNILITIRTIN